MYYLAAADLKMCKNMTKLPEFVSESRYINFVLFLVQFNCKLSHELNGTHVKINVEDCQIFLPSKIDSRR